MLSNSCTPYCATTRCCTTPATKAVARKCFGPLRGYVANIAGQFVIRDRVHNPLIISVSSELSEPQKLLPYLLQPQIATLLPEIIAVYIQAASKIFGHWTDQVAQRWDDDDLPEVKSMVDLIIGRVRDFVSNADVEVQERVGVFPLFRRGYTVSSIPVSL